MKKWVLTSFILLAGIAVVLATAGRKNESIPPETVEAEPVRLNTTLTNSLSEYEGLMGLDSQILAYMKKWELKGASLAIMRNDSLIYAKGYGWADKEAGDTLTPGHIMRVGSVSKLITATAIMQLQERGMLSLQDTVFGPRGILDDSLYTASIRDRRIYGITVEQLLRHKGGFTCGLGDPMFSTRNIIRDFRLDCAPDSRTLVSCVLQRRLGFAPGTSQTYSNFGYLLLSLIIERISGISYADFVLENVLLPAHCYDMHIAGNFYEDRRSNEVRYYMQQGAEPSETYDMSEGLVERCYGGSDITALQGAGAWCASPAELCRFVAAIDGNDGIPDIITKESVEAMTEYFDPETYSLGWNDTKPTGEWTRTGTLAGSTALIKCYPDGECWIMLTNTGTYRGPYFSKHTSTLFRKCREAYSASLPHRNLFE